MQPHAVAPLAAVPHELHAQLGAHEVDGAEPGDERVGGHPHAECDLVGDLERRLERDLAVQLGRGRARLDGSRVASAREAVKTDASLPEPLPHTIRFHRRELAEGLHAEPGEQPYEVAGRDTGDERRPRAERRRLEHRNGQGCKESCCSAGGHHERGLGGGGAGLRRLLGGERSIGDPGAHLVESGLAQHPEQHARRLGLAAVVARRTPCPQRTEPRPNHLHPGSVLLDLRHDRGERAVIPRRIGRDDRQPRTSCLSVATALPATDAFSTRGRGACRDEIVLHHGERTRPVERFRPVASECRDRPVREPQHQAPRGRLQSHLSPPPSLRRRASPRQHRSPGRSTGPASSHPVQRRARRRHPEAADARDEGAATDGSTT